MMDLSTRYPEATPLKQATSTAILDAMLEFFYRVGYPVKILTDNGTNFTSKLMSEVCKRLRIKRIHTSPYHPQTNGALERWQAPLKTMERKTGQGVTEWDRLLGPLLFAYRDSVHEATGFTLFQLLFGRRVRGPLELVRKQWQDKESLPIPVSEFLSELYTNLLAMTEKASKSDLEA